MDASEQQSPVIDEVIFRVRGMRDGWLLLELHEGWLIQNPQASFDSPLRVGQYCAALAFVDDPPGVFVWVARLTAVSEGAVKMTRHPDHPNAVPGLLHRYEQLPGAIGLERSFFKPKREWDTWNPLDILGTSYTARSV